MAQIRTYQANHLGDLLASTAARLPDKEALIYGERRIKWSEYWRNVQTIARAFLELGVQPGDRIGIKSPNCPEYLFVYMASVSIGAIVVGFNDVYTPREVIALARKVKPKIIIISRRNGDRAEFDALMAGLNFVDRLMVIGNGTTTGAISFSGLLADERKGFDDLFHKRLRAVREDDGALIVITGGSNGTPKGALLTHRNIIANIAAQIRHLGFKENDRLLLHLPLSHVSGATILAVPPLMTGASLVVLDRFHPQTTLESIESEKITILGQVPTMFIMEFGLLDSIEYDLSSLRMTIVAAAPTPEVVMARINELAPAVHGYGLTETSGFVTFTDPGDGLARIKETVGRPMPGVEIRIVDDFRRPVLSGEVGEVAVRGPQVMKGYFGEPEETAHTIDESSWFYTGDLGRLDQKGDLMLSGLKKEMYINGGYNVYPREIEEYVCEHEDVALAACVGVEHSIFGQVGLLYVVPFPGSEITPSEILKHCKIGLAGYKIPRRIQVVDQLPMSSIGKIDKARLSKL